MRAPEHNWFPYVWTIYVIILIVLLNRLKYNTIVFIEYLLKHYGEHYNINENDINKYRTNPVIPWKFIKLFYKNDDIDDLNMNKLKVTCKKYFNIILLMIVSFPILIFTIILIYDVIYIIIH